MRENYNSFDYWENVIRENKTIRGHMFMQKPPTEKSLYFHTLIFSKGNGMNNIWGYFPNVKSLIGYLQYSFLQESFYKWIHGKDKLITRIPSISVEKVIEDGERAKKITKEIANKMKKDYQFLSKLWDMPSRDAERELKKFLREFNKKWIGDNREFLYIKLFKSPKEVGDFVVSSATITNSEGELESKIGMKIDEWLNLCENTLKDKKCAEKFRQILLKRLSEVL
ncbi:truncated hemoglobin YjbI [Clostridium butyricum]|nr:truncated hemoglobin YjbI [Clostridium butyricum]NOW38582.1 truncated hemoglobin YjbI [Clostridium butyricum]